MALWECSQYYVERDYITILLCSIMRNIIICSSWDAELRNLYNLVCIYVPWYCSPDLLDKHENNAVAAGLLDWLCLLPFAISRNSENIAARTTTCREWSANQKAFQFVYWNNFDSVALLTYFIFMLHSEQHRRSVYAPKMNMQCSEICIYHSATFLLASEATNHWIKYTAHTVPVVIIRFKSIQAQHVTKSNKL